MNRKVFARLNPDNTVTVLMTQSYDDNKLTFLYNLRPDGEWQIIPRGLGETVSIPIEDIPTDVAMAETS